MYDDAKPNLHTFIELKKDHPRTRFYAWHVSPEGEASEYMREEMNLDEKKRRKKKLRWAAYGPGPYGGYGYAVGYSGSAGDGGGAGGAVGEASYPGNIGMMELVKFMQKAGPQERAILQQLIAKKDYSRAWALIQGLTGVKLQGKEFEDRHPNDTPYGPETKPTMPKGTVKVDVSDIYDWYKLGQHISNLKGLGKHDFGQGAPSTILAFGSEEEEHEYIKALMKTGLTTTDIDPFDPNQPKGMKRQKTDPTYNVESKIKLSTDPNWYGAEVGDYKATGPVVNISANQLVGFEPDDKMNQPKSKANVEKIVAGLKQGDKLPPLLVRKYKNGYQVLDGHHRFWAYKLLGVKEIPAQIVPAKDIEETGKENIEENFADGKKPGRKGLAKRSGVDCGQSISKLRSIAKSSSGERQRMAHWCANMKSGKKK